MKFILKIIAIFFILSAGVLLFADNNRGIRQNMNITRSHDLYSNGLDEESLKSISATLGCGSYWARAAYVPFSQSLDTAPRVMFFFSSLETLKSGSVLKKFFIWKDQGHCWFGEGSDERLLSIYAQAMLVRDPSGKSLNDTIAKAISAVAYESRATLLTEEMKSMSDVALDKIRYVGDPVRSELRLLCENSSVVTGVDGQVTWRGCFLLDTGGVECIIATISLKSGAVVIERKVIRRIGYFPVLKRSGAAAESWDISNVN